MDDRITLAREASARFEEKKSVFIGYATPIKSEAEAREFIEKIEKQHYDARHNCYAYLLDGGTVARYSDNGEPQGTAGVPMLNVLKQSGATDLCVVVTRYFGGILLGAGGLVRAYSAAAKMALDASGFAVYEQYAVYQAAVSYSDYQKLTVSLPKIGAVEDGADFGSDVTVTMAIKADRGEEIEKLIREITYGKSECIFMEHDERLREV